MPASDPVADLEELARVRSERMAEMYLRVSTSRGRDVADRILGDPTSPNEAAGTQISPEQRARNVERAQEWGPALAKVVEKANGDPAVTAAAEDTFARFQIAPVVVVRGSFGGGNGAEQVTSDNPVAPPVVVLKVRDPGARDKTSAGNVTTTSQGSGKAATTDITVEVDPEIVRRAGRGEPADGREARKAAPEPPRELVPMPENPRAAKQREAAERVEKMRLAARAAQAMHQGHGLG